MSAGILRIAIEREGQLPQLILFDQSQPLESIIKEACAKWSISIPEQYAFQYADFNLYITEENRSEIKNGTVLKLMLSPAKLAQDIFDKLQSPTIDDKRNVLNQLSYVAEDLTFAGEFIKRNGHGLVISILEGRPESPEAMASALKAFQEIMEHPGVSWDLLTHGFIKNLTVFVNKKSQTDPTVLNRCLAILESIVSNSSSLYPLVEKEVIFENLIQHLHSGNQEIQLNAIALINGLFSKTNPIYKPQFADRMVKTGVRAALLNYVIRNNKPISGEMAHQLYVFQALMFGLLNDMLLTKGTQHNQNLIEKLDILRKTAFESDIVSGGGGRPLSQAGHPGRDFKRLGFTYFDNPVKDFSEIPPGLLPCHVMHFFAMKHQDQYIKVVLENLSRGDDYECPFARTSIALTKMLCEVLKITGEPPNESSEEYYPIFFTTDHGFEEFFCICIQLVNKTWKEMKATAADFNRVMANVREQIVRSLGERQSTMETFKNYVFNLGFTQIQMLMQQEFHERNIMELQARPVVELKEQILPELKKIVKRQRLDQLIEGRIFERSEKRNKIWYCRLSPNLKFLHYGDCSEGQAPSLEALQNKLAISSIQQIVVGKDCPHAREKRLKASLIFSLIYERETSDESIKSLNFIVPNQKVFDVWVDGLSALLNKEMPSKESKEDLETLLNMEIKLRLLDLENIQIPESPPPVPSDPPNYNFAYNF